MTLQRTKLEIYLEILWIIKNGTKKPTRIMYIAKISWKPLQKILKSMVSQGLIREYNPSEDTLDRGTKPDNRSKKYYELSQKGENVIQYFRGAKDTLGLDFLEVFL